jgi:cytochrome c1
MRALTCVALLALCAGCGQAPPEAKHTVAGGDRDKAPEIMRRYGCGACHVVPGVPGANATVGPPLQGLRDRPYIAGVLANTPENLVRWIAHPREIDPRTAMPDTGITEKEARHVAAYLYTTR